MIHVSLNRNQLVQTSLTRAVSLDALKAQCPHSQVYGFSCWTAEGMWFTASVRRCFLSIHLSSLFLKPSIIHPSFHLSSNHPSINHPSFLATFYLPIYLSIHKPVIQPSIHSSMYPSFNYLHIHPFLLSFSLPSVHLTNSKLIYHLSFIPPMPWFNHPSNIRPCIFPPGSRSNPSSLQVKGV